MELQILPETLAVCRLQPNASIPGWATEGRFFCVTKTYDELSLVCDQERVPDGTKSEKGWTAFRVVGNLDFSLTGILNSIASPLAAAKISLFALSTFDTDYILVKKADLEPTKRCLQNAGFEFV